MKRLFLNRRQTDKNINRKGKKPKLDVPELSLCLSEHHRYHLFFLSTKVLSGKGKRIVLDLKGYECPE